MPKNIVVKRDKRKKRALKEPRKSAKKKGTKKLKESGQNCALESSSLAIAFFLLFQ